MVKKADLLFSVALMIGFATAITVLAINTHKIPAPNTPLWLYWLISYATCLFIGVPIFVRGMTFIRWMSAIYK